jgi:RNA polymerase sigma factor (sigma-70 family)
MRNALSLTSETFEALLAWLGSDREAAGRKYEVIRAGLVRIFVSKGFSDAETLADETINRVAARLHEIVEDYSGDPAAYFRGVARNIIFEASRRKEIAMDTLPERPAVAREVSDEYECLLRCLKFLPSEKRELVLDYHAYQGKDKITNHRVMAEELHITESALRVQAHRARIGLERCVVECVESLQKKRIPSRQAFHKETRVVNHGAREH